MEGGRTRVERRTGSVVWQEQERQPNDYGAVVTEGWGWEWEWGWGVESQGARGCRKAERGAGFRG